jgi:hypothetical protein
MAFHDTLRLLLACFHLALFKSKIRKYVASLVKPPDR